MLEPVVEATERTSDTQRREAFRDSREVKIES